MLNSMGSPSYMQGNREVKPLNSHTANGGKVKRLGGREARCRGAVHAVGMGSSGTRLLVFLSPEPSNNLFAVLPWASYIAFLCLISFSRVKDPGSLRIEALEYSTQPEPLRSHPITIFFLPSSLCTRCPLIWVCVFPHSLCSPLIPQAGSGPCDGTVW